MFVKYKSNIINYIMAAITVRRSEISLAYNAICLVEVVFSCREFVILPYKSVLFAFIFDDGDITEKKKCADGENGEMITLHKKHADNNQECLAGNLRAKIESIGVMNEDSVLKHDSVSREASRLNASHGNMNED